MQVEAASRSLYGFFATGAEGVLWALQRQDVFGYEGLVVLDTGANLCIYDTNMKIAFYGLCSGQVLPDSELSSLVLRR